MKPEAHSLVSLLDPHPWVPLQLPAVQLAFMWVLGIQTTILTFAQQSYPLSTSPQL